MGLFSFVSPIEKRLKEFYIPIFQTTMGIDLTQAKKLFGDVFDQIKNDQKKEGTDNLPPNLGDIFLEKEKTD